MPEGDSIHRLANRARPLLQGQVLVEGRLGKRQDRDLSGRTVTSVRAVGKHLLIGLDDAKTLRVHLGIGGKAPVRDHHAPVDGPVELLLRTEHGQLAVVQPMHCQLFDRRELGRALRHLGPDLLGERFDPDAIALRARGHTGSASQLLLDQRVAAGIGNVYKCELLFVFKIHPERPAAQLADVRPIYEKARTWLQANLTTARRTTTGPTFPSDLYVYDRARRPCVRCRTPVAIETVADRPTYFCPRCQEV